MDPTSEFRFYDYLKRKSDLASRPLGKFLLHETTCEIGPTTVRRWRNVFQYCKSVSAKSHAIKADYVPLPATTPTTDTVPGTAERIAIYCRRVEAGEEVFHKMDYKFPRRWRATE